jgi:hypothetical protein
MHNALLEYTRGLPLSGVAHDSEHWMLAFLEDLLAQFRASGEMDFRDVQRLLQQHERAFLRDLETARRMYRTYPHLFQELAKEENPGKKPRPSFV